VVCNPISEEYAVGVRAVGKANVAAGAVGTAGTEAIAAAAKVVFAFTDPLTAVFKAAEAPLFIFRAAAILGKPKVEPRMVTVPLKNVLRCPRTVGTCNHTTELTVTAKRIPQRGREGFGSNERSKIIGPNDMALKTLECLKKVLKRGMPFNKWVFNDMALKTLECLKKVLKRGMPFNKWVLCSINFSVTLCKSPSAPAIEITVILSCQRKIFKQPFFKEMFSMCMYISEKKEGFCGVLMKKSFFRCRSSLKTDSRLILLTGY
jgi:hypothetical protein